MRSELVKQALLMAIWNRKPSRGLIIHTDQDSQYISDTYLKVLSTWGIRASMSRIGNCWYNAVSERFFANYQNQTNAIFDIADYIGWYNHRRLHGTLDYESPEAYEKDYRERIRRLESNYLTFVSK